MVAERCEARQPQLAAGGAKCVKTFPGEREREGGKAKGKRENISRKTTPKPRREEENRQQFCPIWPVGRGKKDICLRPPAAARLVDGTN